MKSFRTELHLGKNAASICFQDRILTTGSCFADAIGNRLLENKFSALVNPFGAIYNPISIHDNLIQAATNKLPTEETYLNDQGIYKNFHFHSTFANESRPHVQQHIKETLEKTHIFLRQRNFLFITYGTAWVYEHKTLNTIVANCHKQNNQLFTKRLLHVDEIVTSFNELVSSLQSINENHHIILTLSPVRHLKDTLTLNSVSKSTLRIAIHQIVQQYKDVYYFPAYEIMMDDLRDYRFYKSDMIHPSEEAEEYIWSLFTDHFMNDDTRHTLDEWYQVKTALQHKAFHPASPAHQQFLKRTLDKLQQLASRVEVQSEIKSVKEQIL